MDEARVAVSLELEQGVVPPTGVLRPLSARSEASAVPFVGWMELMQRLEDLIGPDEEDRP